MNRVTRLAATAAAAALLAFAPSGAQAQISVSAGGGVASPFGDLADRAEAGWTARGQVGLNLLLVGLHAQAGYTHFGGQDGADDFNTFHYGVGARAGIGPFIWVGATAARFAGDDEGSFGLIPEAGIGVGPLEFVADARITGNAKWYALRGAFRF